VNVDLLNTYKVIYQ